MTLLQEPASRSPESWQRPWKNSALDRGETERIKFRAWSRRLFLYFEMKSLLCFGEIIFSRNGIFLFPNIVCWKERMCCSSAKKFSSLFSSCSLWKCLCVESCVESLFTAPIQWVPWHRGNVFDVTSVGQRSSPWMCKLSESRDKFHLECKLHFPSAQLILRRMHLTTVSASIEAKYWVSWLSFDV